MLPRPAGSEWGMVKHILIVTFFSLFTLGCGGPTREAQLALTITAHALVAADHEIAPRYEAAADEAREHTATWTEYDDAMSAWNAVEMSLRITHSALLAAQAGLDAWRDGNNGPWLASVPCLYVALDELRHAFEQANLSIPLVNEAFSLAGQFAGTCQEAP